MDNPNVKLMRAYGTDAVFKEKTANVQPLAARIGELAMGHAMLDRIASRQTHRTTMQAELMNTMFRVLELAKMEQTIDHANYTPVPMILPANMEDIPAGMTPGMVRIASAIGSQMAKEANEEVPTASLSEGAEKAWKRTGLSGGKWKYKVPALIGAAGVALGGVKAVGAGLNWLGKEPPTAVYGTGGNMVSKNNNEYGTAQPVVSGY
jgi:hypothetical protein